MIPYCILVIEDDDDRAFMERLFVDYHRLMYHEIFKLVHDQWAAEDVMQSTLVRLIDKIPELRIKDRDHLVNYIITASKNQARNYMRDSGRHSTSDLQEFMEYEDPNMDGEAIEPQVIKKEDPEVLSRIWTQLDERTRYLLEGYYILDLPAAAAATIGSRSFIFWCRATLKKFLKKPVASSDKDCLYKQRHFCFSTICISHDKEVIAACEETIKLPT